MRTNYVRINENEKTDSNKLNTQYLNVAHDIADLYRNYIELKNDLEAHNIAIPETHSAIEAQISALNTQLSSMAAGTSIFTLYDNDPILFPTSLGTANLATFQQKFGEATLPVASTELEYHFINPKTGERTLSDNTKELVNSFITNNRFEPKINEIYENSHINAVDASSSKAHVVRTLARNAQINDISLVYNLDTEEIRNINTITVYPIPEMACSYEDIILNKSNGINTTISDISGTTLNMPIANARKRVFRFPVTQVNGITVILNNTNFNIVDGIGTKEFIIGSRLITMENITYLNTGYIGLQIPVPSGKTKIGKITPQYEGEAENIDVSVYDNLSEFNAVGSSSIISGTASTVQQVINTTVTTDTIYVLFKMTLQENNTTPIIKGCVVSWL